MCVSTGAGWPRNASMLTATGGGLTIPAPTARAAAMEEIGVNAPTGLLFMVALFIGIILTAKWL